MAQRLKHLPAMRETRVQSLGREDLLEKEMATHSSTLAWKIPWMVHVADAVIPNDDVQIAADVSTVRTAVLFFIVDLPFV